MDLVRLFIKRISYNQSQNDAFVLIMHEVETDLKLPIVIGTFEAQSIALELEKSLVPPRPLTHDLFKILCIQNGQEYTIEARTSDAIAIALRCNAPIYTYRDIIQRAGIYIPLLNDEPSNTISPSLDNVDEEDSSRNRYTKYALPELKTMLNDCIENEDYEMAALIRDEISKRDSTF